MKTVFERYLEESVQTFHRVYGKALTGEQIMHEFFPDKVASLTREIKTNPNGKTAIVMLGKSCCGKTTFAKNFCREHPEFTLVSMDECAVKDLKEMSEEERLIEIFTKDLLSSDIGNERFGKMIADSQNIVVDGGWGSINSRGALFRTLEYYGYFTSIVSMTNIPEKILNQRREKRVLNKVAKQFLGIDAMDTYDKDYVIIWAKRRGTSYERAVEGLRLTDKYKQEMFMNQLSIEQEEEGSCWRQQEEAYLFFLGANTIYFMEKF